MRFLMIGFLALISLVYADVQAMQRISLQQERIEQAQENSIDLNKSLIKTKSVDGFDTFTQTEAFLSLKKMRDLIAKEYNVTPYQNIIDNALTREKLYKNDFYVFYHGTDSEWRVAQDLYMQLYAYFKNQEKAIGKSFIFLRFQDESAEDATQFLLRESHQKGLVNDHVLKNKLLSVNLSIFANTGSPGECSWQFFIKSRGHAAPTKETYEKILHKFGLPKKYSYDLRQLEKLYQTKEEMLIQIFIPRYYINRLGYIAWIRGIPAYQKLIDWIVAAVNKKRFNSPGGAMEHLAVEFKKEQEKNPLFKEMINQISSGQFKLEPYLHVYRNNPEKLNNINNVTARLLFGTDVLLNPASGAKFFRYSTATQKQLDTYHMQLNNLVDKMIAEKEEL